MSHACPSCDSTSLVPRRAYRHGSLSVFVGRLLLVPSILVLVLGSMGVVGFRPAATREAVERARAATDELASAGVSDGLVAEVVASRAPSDSQLAALSDEQRQSIRRAQMAVAESGAHATMSRVTSSDAFRVLVVLALASGVLGVFLVRKTSVLQCTNCGTSAPSA